MSVKEHVPKLKEKVEYIKNLYEVIRSCYRVLTPEEEMREEKVNFAIQDGVNHSQCLLNFSSFHEQGIRTDIVTGLSECVK